MDRDRPPRDWSKVPPVTPLPRLGGFIIPPSGPGYYSLRDWLEGNYRPEPPRFPFGLYSLNPNPFFDYDFRYLDRPDNMQHDWSDCYKRLHPCDEDWLFSAGGEFRYRFNNEIDSRLSGRDNRYDHLRERVYGDLWYRDEFRVFVEYIDARSFGQDLPITPIDATNSDLLDFFVEARVGDLFSSPLYLRAGRQELLYGSQRLISNLEWANTLRTFQGIKGYWHSDRIDVDLFWVQPVVPSADQFDSINNRQNFLGLWTTWKPRKGTTLDVYYLNLSSAVADIRGDTSTVGARYAGDLEGRFLFDFEGMYQFGERGSQPISAPAATAGLGYRFARCRVNPEFWVYYDFASGDADPGGPGNYGTFNQLFPFGHYYLGYLDVVARQNIQDLNFQLTFNPQPWITVWLQGHIFRLDSERDALYGANGLPLRRDPTGAAGNDVGEELDVLVNFHLSSHQDLLIAYSKLYAGQYLKRTGNPGSPEFFYTQYSFRW